MDQLRRKVVLTGAFGIVALVGAARAQTPAPAGAPTPSQEAPPPASANPAPAPAPAASPATDGKPAWTYLVPVVGPLISGFLAYVGVRQGLRVGESNASKAIEAATRTSQAAVWQKANEAEVASILGKLDGFYGPFVQLSGVNRLLAGDLRDRLGLGEEFRLMLALCGPGWREALSTGDQQVVRQICSNAERLERLVEGEAGAVDEALAPYLARAATHFRFLRLAGERELGDDPKPFERYVYPEQLDDVVDLEVDRLRRRLAALRGTPAAAVGAIELLVIPERLRLRPWPEVTR